MDLIRIEKNEKYGFVVSSRVVAEELGKEHRHVLRDIREKSLSNFGQWIIPSKYKAGNGQEYDEYLLTRDGFTMLVFNYSGYLEFKEAYINKFNEMEKQIQEVVNKKLLLADLFDDDKMVVVNAHKQLVEMAKKPLLDKIELDKPRVEFAETIEKSSDSILVRDVSKILANEGLKFGEKKLYGWLRENGLIEKHKNMPTQKAINLNLFVVTESYYNTAYGKKLSLTPKVTGRGQIYIVEKIKNELLKQA